MKRWCTWLAVAVGAMGLVGGGRSASADEVDSFGVELEARPQAEQTNFQREREGGREAEDAASRLDRVVEKLDRLVDQMQAARPQPPSPPRGPGFSGPGFGGGPNPFGPGSPFGGPRPFNPGVPGVPGDDARPHRDPHGRDQHAGRHAEHGRPHGDREHRGPDEQELGGRPDMRREGRRDPQPRWGGPDQERMREMMQQGMREAQRRMEQARDKVRELEDRVKKLEAEIERMKST
ncbi:MAG: hypothetical protein ACKOTB_08930 [Planctomycetia bacterium]